ncbi:MAG: acetate--CoA ligase, partial [Gemmatimonadetes bacterium]|nr:acetate--CoA ligase [Gemmatimonadota bacterium]
MSRKDIESLLKEKRLFEPDPLFQSKARVGSVEEYEKLYKESIEDRDGFWNRIAGELHWFRKWSKTLDWKPPHAQWFVGGKTNLSYNCLDVHCKTWRRNKAAIVWEGEPGEERTLTYQMLHREVCKFANVLKARGIEPGDRVAIYMPLVPELAIAMLACARIGATHSIIFGGFSARAIADRVNDAAAKLVITADGGYRRGKIVPLKETVDEAMRKCKTVESVIVYQRTKENVGFKRGRDHWWHDLMAEASPDCPAEKLDAEHPLFILYTSGSTGRPKGVLHTTGGYMVGTYYTSRMVFDLKEEDTYWCTADIGWITGHSYVVYGPLANGATTVMYEGTPTHPGPDRWWDLIEKWGVSIFYTAPTALRTFIRLGDAHPKAHDLTSLRLLGSVGEPINPEAWMWYYRVIGKERCPIVDTWWQTETGGILITPLPGATPLKPGSATFPFFGVEPVILEPEKGTIIEGNDVSGVLAMKGPWPGQMRTIYGDHERFETTYFQQYKG